MSVIDKKCTVLVCSNDMNEDLWDPFFLLVKVYWKDCPYQFVLNTPSKTYRKDGMEIKCFQLFPENGQQIPFGRRLIACLKQIESPYIFFLLDDHFLRHEVMTSEMKKIIQWMEGNSQIACFNFEKYNDDFNEDDNKYDGYVKRSRYGTYRYNSSPAIWRREALIKAWKWHESVWQWEAWGNMRSWKESIIIYIPKLTCRPPILYRAEDDAIVSGRWAVDKVDELFKNNNIDVDYEKRGVAGADIKIGSRRSRRAYSLKSIGLLRFLACSLFFITNLPKRAGKSLLVEYSNKLNKKFYEKES